MVIIAYRFILIQIDYKACNLNVKLNEPKLPAYTQFWVYFFIANLWAGVPYFYNFS